MHGRHAALWSPRRGALFAIVSLRIMTAENSNVKEMNDRYCFLSVGCTRTGLRLTVERSPMRARFFATRFFPKGHQNRSTGEKYRAGAVSRRARQSASSHLAIDSYWSLTEASAERDSLH